MQYVKMKTKSLFKPLVSLLFPVVVSGCLPDASVIDDGHAPGLKVENSAPVSVDLSLSLEKNGDLSGTLLGSDADSDTLTFTIVEQGALGILTLSNANSGAFRYVANANVTGLDRVTFKISDGKTESKVASLSIEIVDSEVAPVNSTPSATALSFSTNEDVNYVSDGTTRAHLAGVDAESSALGCAKASDPSHGAVTVNSDCSFSYAPTANYNGSDFLLLQ